MDGVGLEDVRQSMEEVQKAIETLATTNEERSSYVQEVYNKAVEMYKELDKVRDVLNTSKKAASDLHMLSLNTAIEAARAANPAVGVIAKEMDKMSKNFSTFTGTIHDLGADMADKVSWLEKSLSSSVDSVETTTATLEEINASAEQVIATMHEL